MECFWNMVLRDVGDRLKAKKIALEKVNYEIGCLNLNYGNEDVKRDLHDLIRIREFIINA